MNHFTEFFAHMPTVGIANLFVCLLKCCCCVSTLCRSFHLYTILSVKEIAKSKVLCRYVQHLNIRPAILSVEVHANKIKDPIEKANAIDGYNIAKSKLEGCGIKFQNLPAFWTN